MEETHFWFGAGIGQAGAPAEPELAGYLEKESPATGRALWMALRRCIICPHPSQLRLEWGTRRNLWEKESPARGRAW